MKKKGRLISWLLILVLVASEFHSPYLLAAEKSEQTQVEKKADEVTPGEDSSAEDTGSVQEDADSAQKDTGPVQEDADSAQKDTGSAQEDADSAQEDAEPVQQDVEQDTHITQQAQSLSNSETCTITVKKPVDHLFDITVDSEQALTTIDESDRYVTYSILVGAKIDIKVKNDRCNLVYRLNYQWEGMSTTYSTPSKEFKNLLVDGEMTIWTDYNVYPVCVDVDASEGIQVKNTSMTAPLGSYVNLEVSKVDNGYQFDGWYSMNGILLSTDMTYRYFIMYQNNQIVYAKSHRVSYQQSVYVASGLGTVTGDGSYLYGEKVTLKATPASGWEVEYWQDAVTGKKYDNMPGNTFSYTVENERTMKVAFTQKSVHVNVEKNGDGIVSPSSDCAVNSYVHLKAEANTGSRFVKWTKNGKDFSRQPEIYAALGTADVTFQAVFEKTQCLVSVIQMPNKDTINQWLITGETKRYNYGDTCTLSCELESDDGWEFSKWLIKKEAEENWSSKSQSTISFTVTDNTTVIAVYTNANKKIVLPLASPAAGGIATIKDGVNNCVDPGQQISLVATASSGYHFVKWTDVNGQVIGNTTEIAVTAGEADIQIYHANFERDKIKIHTEVNPDLSGKVSGAGTYEYGEKVELKATPEDGYQFQCWKDQKGNILSYDEIYPIQVEKETTYYACFETKTYHVTLENENENGFVWIKNETEQGFEKNATAELMAVPRSGYLFQGWYLQEGDSPKDTDPCISTENKYSYCVTDDVTLYGIFYQEESYISAKANNDDYGSVSGSGMYQWKDSVTLMASAKEGYVFHCWQDEKGIVVSTDASWTFRAQSTKSYTAVFVSSKLPIQVNIEDQTLGNVTIEDANTHEIIDNQSLVSYGTELILTAAPQENENDFSCFMKDGVVLSKDKSIHVKVEDDGIITAYFKKNPVIIEATSAEPSYGEVVGGGVYSLGETVTLEANEKEGYHFLGWKKDGEIASREKSLTFSALEDSSYQAYFYPTYVHVQVVCEQKNGSAVGDGYYASGSEVVLSANPQRGYDAESWTNEAGEELSQESTYTFIATEDATIHLSFKQHKYNLNFKYWNEETKTYEDQSPYGTIQMVSGTDEYKTTDTFTAQLTEEGVAGGYVFEAYKDQNQNVLTWDETYTTESIESDMTYYVAFVQPYDVAITKEASYTDPFAAEPFNRVMLEDVTPVVNEFPIQNGKFKENVTIDYGTVDDNLNFVGWYFINENQEEECITHELSFSMQVLEPVTYYAKLSLKPVAVKATVREGADQTGTEHVEGETKGSGYRNPGEQIALEANPTAEGSILVGWEEMDSPDTVVGRDSQYKVTVPEDQSGPGEIDYQAEFSVKMYNVKVQVDDASHGATALTGSYPYGTKLSLPQANYENYEFDYWETPTGKVKDQNLDVTVTSDLTVKAHYKSCPGKAESSLSILPITMSAVALAAGFTVYLKWEGKKVESKIKIAIGALVGLVVVCDVAKEIVNRLDDDSKQKIKVTISGEAVEDYAQAGDVLPTKQIILNGVVGNSVTVDYGTMVTLAAQKIDHYYFVGWRAPGQAEGEYTSKSDTFVVEAVGAISYQAVYEKYRTIEVEPDPWTDGTVEIVGDSLDCTSKEVKRGEMVTLKASVRKVGITNLTTFKGWFKDGQAIVASEDVIFDQNDLDGTHMMQYKVYSDAVIVAGFQKIDGKVITYASPYQGGRVSTIYDEVAAGKKDAFVATPMPGYQFDGWFVPGKLEPYETDYTIEFTVEIPITVLEARFSKKDIQVVTSVNNTNAGTVEGGHLAGSENPHNFDQAFTLLAKSNEGYAFTKYTDTDGNFITSKNPYIFYATEDREIVANFEEKSYQLSVSSNSVLGGAVSGSGTYQAGKVVKLQATPEAKYSFVGWYEDGTCISTEQTFDYKVTKDADIQGRFVDAPIWIQIEAFPSNGGAVTESMGFQKAEIGQSMTLNAKPNSGYEFVHWQDEKGANISDFDETEVHISTSKTYTAVFKEKEKKQYTITIDDVKQHLLDGEEGQTYGEGTFEEGESVCVIAQPAPGFQFAYWADADCSSEDEDTCLSKESTYTFEINKNMHLKAVFTKENFVAMPSLSLTIQKTQIKGVTFPISVGFLEKNSSGGVVKGKLIGRKGEQGTAEAVADYGYAFVGWAKAFNTDVDIDGVPENNNPDPDNLRILTSEPKITYTFGTSNVLIAVFVPQLYTVTAKATTYGSYLGQEAGGTVRLDGGRVSSEHVAVCYHDQKIRLTAIPNPGYRFVRWTGGGGTVVSHAASFETSIILDSTFTAEFAKSTHTITATAKPILGGETVVNELIGDDVMPGTAFVLTAIPNVAMGYEFSYWANENGTHISTLPILTLYAPESANYTAIFKKSSVKVTVTADPEEGGSVTPRDTSLTMLSTGIDGISDSKLKLEAKENEGYTFDGWYLKNGDNLEAVSTEKTCTIVASQDLIYRDSLDYVAKYKQVDHKVTVNSVGEGVVSPETAMVKHGADKVITCSPANGFYVSSIAVNGVEQEIHNYSGGTYLFTIANVQEDVLVDVKFTEVENPEIQKDLENEKLVDLNQVSSFTLEIEGNAKTYQWYKDGVKIKGATQSTYTCKNAQKNQEGTYYCELSSGNQYGIEKKVLSQKCKVTILEKMKSPEDLEMDEVTDQSITCSFSCEEEYAVVTLIKESAVVATRMVQCKAGARTQVIFGGLQADTSYDWNVYSEDSYQRESTKVQGEKFRTACTVTFDFNDGSQRQQSLYCQKGSTFGPDMIEKPTREGYTFVEWNTQADGEGEIFTKLTKVATTGITYYAKWILNAPEGAAIDFEKEVITGVDLSMCYSMQREGTYQPVESTEIPIADSMLGNQIYIKRGDSLPEILSIPKRPDAPDVQIDYANETTAQKITSWMEYRQSGADEWQQGMNEKIPLNPNTKYEFRYRNTEKAFSSEICKLDSPERGKAPVQWKDETSSGVHLIITGNELSYENVNDKMEYSIGAGSDLYQPVTGASIEVTDSMRGDVLNIRYRATTSAYASETLEIVIPGITGAPTIENLQIDYRNETLSPKPAAGKTLWISVTGQQEDFQKFTDDISIEALLTNGLSENEWKLYLCYAEVTEGEPVLSNTTVLTMPGRSKAPISGKLFCTDSEIRMYVLTRDESEIRPDEKDEWENGEKVTNLEPATTYEVETRKSAIEGVSFASMASTTEVTTKASAAPAPQESQFEILYNEEALKVKDFEDMQLEYSFDGRTYQTLEEKQQGDTQIDLSAQIGREATCVYLRQIKASNAMPSQILTYPIPAREVAPDFKVSAATKNSLQVESNPNEGMEYQQINELLDDGAAWYESGADGYTFTSLQSATRYVIRGRKAATTDAFASYSSIREGATNCVITGEVKEKTEGLAGVKVYCGNETEASYVTDAYGHYEFDVPYGEEVSMRYERSGYTFYPDEVTYQKIRKDEALTVYGVYHTIRFAGGKLEDGTYATAYEATIPEARGGSGDFSYEMIGDMPEGLVFDSMSRKVSGTPTKAGTYRMTVKVTDVLNPTKTKSANYYLRIQKLDVSDSIVLEENEVVYDGSRKWAKVTSAYETQPRVLSIYKEQDTKSLFAPIHGGDYTIDAEVIDTNCTGSKSFSYKILKASQSIYGTSTYTKKYRDGAFTLDDTAKTALTYKVVEGQNVVSVNSQGIVTIKDVGMAQIQIDACETRDYLSAQPKIVTVVVEPAEIYPIELDNQIVTYNGKAQMMSVSGCEETIQTEITYSIDGTENTSAPVHAGKYQVKAVVTDPRYVKKTLDAVLTIQKAPLTIKAKDTQKYVGDDNPDFEVVITGFQNKDTEKSLLGTLAYSTTADAKAQAGEYKITPYGYQSDDYRITYLAGVLDIEEKSGSSSQSVHRDKKENPSVDKAQVQEKSVSTAENSQTHIPWRQVVLLIIIFIVPIAICCYIYKRKKK